MVGFIQTKRAGLLFLMFPFRDLLRGMMLRRAGMHGTSTSMRRMDSQKLSLHVVKQSISAIYSTKYLEIRMRSRIMLWKPTLKHIDHGTVYVQVSNFIAL